MTNAVPLPSGGVTALWRAAAAKKICRDADEFLDALSGMGGDLFPDRGIWRGLRSLREFDADEAGKSDGGFDWRAIGDLFWREGGSLEERRLAGSFYTPERIIDRILDLLGSDILPGLESPELSAPLCDPAMGSGFFYLRLIDRLLAEGRDPDAVRRWAAANLYGVDREAGAVFLTRVLMWLTLSEPGKPFRPDPDKLRCGDSLLGPGFGEAGMGDGLNWADAFPAVASKGGFSVVMGNPPYEVLTNFSRYPASRRLAGALRASGWYSDSLKGQINLYRCFIERGLRLLRNGGAMALVVPFSLARDAAAAGLRRRLLLSEAASEWRFYDEGDALFRGVTQSACVFSARKGGGAAEKVRVVSSRGRAEFVVAELEDFGGGVMAIPDMGDGERALWRWLRENAPGKLSALAEMRVGEVDQTVYRDCMRDTDTGCILARGAHLRAFFLDTSSVPGPERFLDRERFLDKKGGGAARCLRRVSGWRLAQLGIRNMRTRPRLAAATVPPGVYLGNSLNVYYPKDGISLAFLGGLLNSRLLDWLFSLGSGNNNINLREMAGLPVPFPGKKDAAAIVRIETAFRRCEVAAAGANRKLPDEKAVLDREVEMLYGVPDELVSAVFS